MWPGKPLRAFSRSSPGYCTETLIVGYPVAPFGSGATDATGYTQTAALVPPEPNGATGYPTINVSVQ